MAPSPTGALHLGNARTFLINWAMARQQGWRILLRVEDLDGPRIKPEAAQQAVDILRWLGVDWDEGPVYQSHDLEPYFQAMESLRSRGLIYPCRCSRREIELAQSAPHEDEHELRYPGTCRGDGGASRAAWSMTKIEARGAGPAWRVRIPDEPVAFCDAVHGEQVFNVQQQVGDFVVATRNGLPAYQLAVVVDDARQGVTDVVRGDDLLASTARQIWLYRILGLGEPPRYTHLPLVLGPDGRRLAKRHGDTRLTAYQARGVPAKRIVGLIAYWSGVQPRREPMSAEAFAQAFALDRLPRRPITFTPEDEAWLAQ